MKSLLVFSPCWLPEEAVLMQMKAAAMAGTGYMYLPVQRRQAGRKPDLPSVSVGSAHISRALPSREWNPSVEWPAACLLVTPDQSSWQPSLTITRKY